MLFHQIIILFPKKITIGIEKTLIKTSCQTVASLTPVKLKIIVRVSQNIKD